MSYLSRKFAVPVAALLLSGAACVLQAQSTTVLVPILTVTSSPNPSVFAAPVTFTVSVAPPPTASLVAVPIPTGTVSATLLGPILLGTATLDKSGKAVITVPAQPNALASPWGLPAGSNTITFSYSGDSNYKTAQSTFLQFVQRADTTTTADIAGNGEPQHLTATVKIHEPSVSNSPFALPGNLSSSSPTGSVQFFNGTTVVGSAILLPSGLFTSTATLAVGPIPASLTAVYTGDDNYNGSTSATVGGGGHGTVGLTVTSSINPSTFAQPVTFTILVAPSTAGGSTPTGTVSASLLGLFDLGTVKLDSTGKGSITIPASASAVNSIPWSLPAGSDTITFIYSGDASYSAAKTDFTQMVDKAATTTTATVGASDTSITATVAISEPVASQTGFALPGLNNGGANPSGTVQFLNGGTVIGTAVLIPNGHFQSSATLTVKQPFSSTANLIAVYNGDANYNGSTSPPATIPTLTAVTVGVSSSVNPATFAEPVTLSIKVAPATAGNVIPTGTLQASVQGSDILGGANLDNTGSATITVPSQFATANAGLPWGLATGPNAITVAYSGDSNFAAAQTTLNQLVNQADTTTTLIPAPQAFGSTTFAALIRVSINEPSVSKTDFRIPTGGNLGTAPSGKLDLFDGPTLLQTVKLIPGALFESTVSISVTPVPASIRAVYYGDTNYNGSSSQSTSLGNQPVSITLVSSANPTTYGAAFTVMATVSPATAGGPTPTGGLQFFDGSQNLNWTAMLDSTGKGSLPIPLPMATPLACVITCPSANVGVLGAGSHTITVQYSGDVNYAPAKSTSSLQQQITKAPTITSVTGFAAILDPPGGTITATVADGQPPSGGPYHFLLMGANGLTDGNPTGTVTFYNNSSAVIGTGKLAPNFSGNVTSTASLYPVTGGPNFSAIYPGDANFQPSSSGTGATTIVSLTGAPNPSNAGQSVTLTATVLSAKAGPTLTGTVDFLDGTTLLGSANVSAGAAGLTTTFTSSGMHLLTARYSGDANYQSSTSAQYTQVVNPSTTPTDSLKLAISSPAAVYGQHVVLFAQVAGNVNTPPTGTVNFLDGTTIIGSGVLSLGSAYAVVTLAVGTHHISAVWVGDANWPAAQSGMVALTVNPAPTATSLTNFGTVWTAVVIALPPGAGTPTGTVQLVDTVTQAVLATATLNAGSATVTLNGVTHPLQAVYSGDGNFQPSKSRGASTGPTLHRTR